MKSGEVFGFLFSCCSKPRAFWYKILICYDVSMQPTDTIYSTTAGVVSRRDYVK